MNVPRWVDEVGQLFPRQAKEVMERELVNRRGMRELMEKPEMLEKIEPNLELVKTLLTHRDLLNEKTRALARKIIDKVVQELKKKMKVQVEPAITGAIRRDRHSPRRVFRNLDLGRTAPPQPAELRRRHRQAAGRPALLLRRRAEEPALARHRRRRPVRLDARLGHLLGRHGVDLRRTAGRADVPGPVRHPGRRPVATRSASRSTCCSRSSSAAAPTSPRRSSTPPNSSASRPGRSSCSSPTSTKAAPSGTWSTRSATWPRPASA